MKAKTVIRTIRIPFLILTPACVFLGASTVLARHEAPDLSLLSLALLGALLAHISVNTLNEYFDFTSGLDLETLRTPFSGGSGALPDNPEMAKSVLLLAALSTVALILIGVYFIWQRGAAIIPIGITGILLITSYTGWINKHPIVCLIAPGTGFGILMVVGTQFVLEGNFSTLSWLVASVPFFLINNLLLLNQYPDIEADRAAGRKHFPIAYGIRHSNIIYGIFAGATVAVITGGVLSEQLPALSLIALLPMPLSLLALAGATRYGNTIGRHPGYLAANVAATVLTISLLAISLVM